MVRLIYYVSKIGIFDFASYAIFSYLIFKTIILLNFVYKEIYFTKEKMTMKGTIRIFSELLIEWEDKLYWNMKKVKNNVDS